jgi:retron-type reverse transcriptase
MRSSNACSGSEAASRPPAPLQIDLETVVAFNTRDELVVALGRLLNHLFVRFARPALQNRYGVRAGGIAKLPAVSVDDVADQIADDRGRRRLRKRGGEEGSQPLGVRIRAVLPKRPPFCEDGRGDDANLRELRDRVHSGRYEPQPVRRAYIPKADGGKRPLGILALEDKIVQGAMAEVLSAVYEADFHDCSYGFRPGRSAHQALRTINDAIISERVNWVFEADIRKFYDSINHEWLMRMIELRIADPRVLRLIRQWLAVGVLENGVYAETVEGTPQGAGISPLLANIFLHYALDLWVGQWMRRAAIGRLRLVRYADDFLLTFEQRADADRMAKALAERLAKFGLRLHEDRTRLIEFRTVCRGEPPATGRRAARDVRLSGLHAPLRENPGRTVHGPPQNPARAHDP